MALAPYLRNRSKSSHWGSLGLFVLLGLAAAAQSPPLEGSEQRVPPSSSPSDLTVMGDHVYFVAEDGSTGRELWRTNGEPGNAERIQDIVPGSEGAVPERLLAVGNRLYFSAATPDTGRELWFTDGTPAGTHRTRDLRPGRDSSDPAPLLARGAELYFRARTGATGEELWKTDGTAEGTVLVKDMFEGPNDSSPGQLGVASLGDGTFLLTGYNALGPSILWRSDGTGAGTTYLPFAPSFCDLFHPLGGKALFRGQSMSYGTEPWISDGTAEGTFVLKDINPGDAYSLREWGVELGIHLLFSADDVAHGQELWGTDGTAEGTILIKDINPGAGSSDPYKYVRVGNEALFIANDGQTGKELWRTDGTPEGTRLVRDIYKGPASAEPYAFAVAGGSLFFSAREDLHGEELWRYESATGDAHLVADIIPGPQSSEPYATVALGDIGVFAANHPDTGTELWRSDGTPEGTVPIADIFHESFENPSSSPTELTPVASGLLYFVVNDLEHGAELWVTGGSGDNTRLVKDIFPGPASSDPRHLTPMGDVLYFEADDGYNGRELWKSDGTALGTALAVNIGFQQEGAGIKEMVTFDRVLLIVATKAEVGEELLIVSTDSHLEVCDIQKGPDSSHPEGLVVVPSANKAYFRADDGVHGVELWYVESGQGYEAHMVRDIVPAPRTGAKFEALVPFGDGVAAVIDDAVHGAELWRVGGEKHDAGLVKDLRTEETLRSPAKR